jgi:hypothetical protein
MGIRPEEIAYRLNRLVEVLKKSKNQEQDKEVLKLYDIHIKETEKLILTLESSPAIEYQLKDFYKNESRNYGWSYLPNKNGETAELEFWNLMKDLGYFKGN